MESISVNTDSMERDCGLFFLHNTGSPRGWQFAVRRKKGSRFVTDNRAVFDLSTLFCYPSLLN